MKASIFSAFAAVALLASSSAFAATPAAFGHDRDDHRHDRRREDHRRRDFRHDRHDRDHRGNDRRYDGHR